MAKAIVMPKQGNTVEECILVSWAIKVGDSVSEGQVIGEIETDKATFSLEATASGQVLALLCEEGDAVPVLENVVVVGEARPLRRRRRCSSRARQRSVSAPVRVVEPRGKGSTCHPSPAAGRVDV